MGNKSYISFDLRKPLKNLSSAAFTDDNHFYNSEVYSVAGTASEESVSEYCVSVSS